MLKNTLKKRSETKKRNQLLKLKWQNRCKKIDEIGILCGDELWDICDQTAASLFYPCLGTEVRRIFKSKHPLFLNEKEPMKELWSVMEFSSTKNRNITFHRFDVFSSKQQKGEPVESFYGKLIEQAENCSLRDQEKTLIRETIVETSLTYPVDCSHKKPE